MTRTELKIMLSPEENRANQKIHWEILKESFEATCGEAYVKPFFAFNALNEFFNADFIEDDEDRVIATRYALSGLVVPDGAPEEWKAFVAEADNHISIAGKPSEEPEALIEFAGDLSEIDEWKKLTLNYRKADYKKSEKTLIVSDFIDQSAIEAMKLLRKHGQEVEKIVAMSW